MNNQTQTIKIGKGYQMVGTITDPMQIWIEQKPKPNQTITNSHTAEADFATPIIDRKPMNHYDMVARQGRLTILDKEDYYSKYGPKIDLTPYMSNFNDTRWTIDNYAKIEYQEDSAVIVSPSLRVRFAVDMLVWEKGHLKPTAIPDAIVADLKQGLRINGPDGDDTINLTPYILTEQIEIGLNKQTVTIGETDMYIESEHMFAITVTFKPEQLSILGRRTE